MGSKIISWYAGCIPCLDNEEAIDEYLHAIKFNLQQDKKLENQLRDRIKELEDEYYKDIRLQELMEELDRVRADARRGFSIEAKESEGITAWKKEHDTKIHNNPNQYHGASGGGYTYEFYPTGIGTFGKCICGACHRKAFKEAAGDVDKYSELMKSWNASISFDDV
jgi:hypothetical protein